MKSYHIYATAVVGFFARVAANSPEEAAAAGMKLPVDGESQSEKPSEAWLLADLGSSEIRADAPIEVVDPDTQEVTDVFLAPQRAPVDRLKALGIDAGALADALAADGELADRVRAALAR